jgi:hypothetical protein
MNLHNYPNDVFGSRDIRRFPSELDRVPSRNAAQAGEIGRKATYSELVASVGSANAAAAVANEPPTATNAKPFSLWEKESFGFGDFLDIINPLHHIPIVATIYRNLSSDQIGAVPRVIGGAVWGRIGGFVAGVVNAVVEWWSGKDVGDHIYAAVFGDPKKAAGATALAQKQAPIADAATSAVTAHKAPALPADDANKVPGAQTFAGAARESGGTVPTAVRSEAPMSLTSSGRLALNSYAKNRRWRETDESLGIRLPI